jgi:hypothetical protein
LPTKPFMYVHRWWSQSFCDSIQGSMLWPQVLQFFTKIFVKNFGLGQWGVHSMDELHSIIPVHKNRETIVKTITLLHCPRAEEVFIIPSHLKITMCYILERSTTNFSWLSKQVHMCTYKGRLKTDLHFLIFCRKIQAKYFQIIFVKRCP